MRDSRSKERTWKCWIFFFPPILSKQTVHVQCFNATVADPKWVMQTRLQFNWKALGNWNITILNVILFQAVLNQKFTDCFVLVFLDSQAGKTVSYSNSVLRMFIHFHFVSKSDKAYLWVQIPVLHPPAPYRAWKLSLGSRCRPRHSRAAVLLRSSSPCTTTLSLWSTQPATTCGRVCCRTLMEVGTL